MFSATTVLLTQLGLKQTDAHMLEGLILDWLWGL
jgi:hypothetical protein